MLRKNSWTKKNINIFLVTILITFVVLFFFINLILLRPNILTWWSDEYEYVSQARNFALFNDLDTSFYSAKAVIYGEYPSRGYHPALFSFLMGSFLKVFRANPNTTFIFNYLLLFLSVLVFYFYSRQRLERRLTYYPLLLILLFPLVLIFLNIQSPEIFFILLITLGFYIFFRNRLRFNVAHFGLLTVLAMISIQRITYILVVIMILTYIYINWIKKKKIIQFLSSLGFYVGLFLILYYFFSTNLQVYLAPQDMHFMQYLKFNGLTSLFSYESWSFLFNHTTSNIKNIISILISVGSPYFYINWLILFILGSNTYFLFSSKDKETKKELAFILPITLVLALISVVFYVTSDQENFTHIRLFLGLIPLNLFYFYLFAFRSGKIKKIIFISIYLVLFITSSIFILGDFYHRKNSSLNILNSEKYSSVFNKFENIKNDYEDDIVIAGIDDEEAAFRDYIVYADKKYRFIRFNQFQVTEGETKEFIDNYDVDIWLSKKNDNHINHYLNKWPLKTVLIDDDNPWLIYRSADQSQLQKIYNFDFKNFNDFWRPVNNCDFKMDNRVIINASGNDPYFESKTDLILEAGEEYYLEISIETQEESYLQIFFKDNNGNYSESNSSRLNTVVGDNYFITMLNGTNIRIDPGTSEGQYVVNYINIYRR